MKQYILIKVQFETGYDMLAALDRINNYEEVLREFKVRKQSEESGLTSMASVVNASQAETRAAVAIQSAFKGYKIRKEIKEIQTFYKQVSGSEDQIAGLSIYLLSIFVLRFLFDCHLDLFRQSRSKEKSSGNKYKHTLFGGIHKQH